MSIAFLGFEFSVVSGLPIGSEQAPQARGTMLALVVMSSSIGRMLGAVTGGAFYTGAGFTVAALVSGLIAIATVILFVWGIRERG
jgi:predicted MFS family arabinose efflux permease